VVEFAESAVELNAWATISREQYSCACLVVGEASRCVIHFFEPPLGDLRRPNTREIQARLNDGCDVRTHSRQWNADDPTNRAFR